MQLKRSDKNTGKKKRIAHIIAAVIILVHGYEKFDSGHGSYLLFAIAGCIFLAIAILHTVIEKKSPWIDGVFFIIEGILSIIVAIDFFHTGKKGLPVCYLLLGIFQFIIAFRVGKKGMQHHKATE